jgi:excisionase family DNA binding protein
MATTNQSNTLPAGISLDEFCERVGISRQTGRRRIADGTIRAVRIGRRIVIPASELVRILGIAPPMPPVAAGGLR